MKRALWLLMVCALASQGCIDDCDEIPKEPGWKKFEGTYNVTKLENGETYELLIKFDTLTHIPSGERHLYIIYENFDASFDSLLIGYVNNNEPNRILRFNAEFPEYDRWYNRWTLWMIPEDTLTPEPENTLVNDTILFYFRKSNLAFYNEDGVPYYECYCKHRAVKVQ